MRQNKGKFLIAGIFVTALFSLTYFSAPLFSLEYETAPATALTGVKETPETTTTPPEPSFVVTHVPTPLAVKAIYMTSWVGGTKDLRERLVGIVDETEINAIVLDIKDYSGQIAFEVEDPLLREVGASERRIPDIKEFIGYLHDKDIYVIGRISVFQDPIFAKKYPELAVQKQSDKTVWKDYKGLSFVDVSAKEFWDYIVALGEESYAVGFDELNFDYVRFPSDGNMKDIYYPVSEKRILEDPIAGKASLLENFFAYLHRKLSPTGVVLSADLFGMTMTNSDDLNIGQVLERAAPYFDFIAPMVYPSHYPKNFNGYENPNKYPYEIVKFSMDKGVARLIAASSSSLKLRPWIQDFDYGGNYDIPEIQAQKKAVYDAGLTSWMIWDPSNRYTVGALDKE